MHWYVMINGEQVGPYEESTIKSLIASGEISPQDTVWREGMPQWSPVGTVPELAPLVQGSHPPPVPPVNPGPTGNPQRAGTPGTAIASFILGLLSFVAGLLTGLPALICGHIALGSYKKSPGLSGKWMAVTGLVIGYFSIILTVIGLLAALAIPSFQKARENAQEKTCINNLRQIKGAVQMYAVEQNKSSYDTISYTDWEEIKSYLDDNTPTCPYSDEPYEKPGTFSSDPECPNESFLPEHALPY